MENSIDVYFIHCSDTAQTSSDIMKHDTTCDRIECWYDKIIKKLGIKTSKRKGVQLIGSRFGNSFETAAQAICMLEKLGKNAQTQVVLVNNASRAKHEDSQESKGSDCLWAEVEIKGVTHHIVGVDDDAFLFLKPYMKKGTAVSKIASVKDSCIEGIEGIPDLSKGTQFRSKNYFILVQLLLIKELQERGEIIKSEIEKYFTVESNYSLESSKKGFRERLLDVLGQYDLGILEDEHLIEDYKKEVKRNLRNVIKKGGVVDDYQKTYLPGFEGIEKIQLKGEVEMLEKKIGISWESIDLPLGTLNKYKTFRKSLKENQIGILDRDKFGNIKCVYSDKIGSFDGFMESNKVSIGKKIKIVNGETSESLECFLVKSISDKTGENCIWQGSSRGADGEGLIELNRSFCKESSSGKMKKNFLQTLPIGTILTVS